LSATGRHRTGWGLDEACASFLEDYNAIKEVKIVKKPPKTEATRVEEGTRLKDLEDIIGFE
jgi:hypothetical protein